jgi:hypothetical protein
MHDDQSASPYRLATNLQSVIDDCIVEITANVGFELSAFNVRGLTYQPLPPNISDGSEPSVRLQFIR